LHARSNRRILVFGKRLLGEGMTDLGLLVGLLDAELQLGQDVVGVALDLWIDGAYRKDVDSPTRSAYTHFIRGTERGGFGRPSPFDPGQPLWPTRLMELISTLGTVVLPPICVS
jgi:hypothetical protein